MDAETLRGWIDRGMQDRPQSERYWRVLLAALDVASCASDLFRKNKGVITDDNDLALRVAAFRRAMEEK